MLRVRSVSVLLLAAVACAAVCWVSAAAADSGGGAVLHVQNPFMLGLGGNDVAADPDVWRVTGYPDADSDPFYILTHTVKNSGGSDFPIYRSSDLVNWELHAQALDLTLSPNDEASVQIGAYHYCGNWAPEIRPVQTGGYALSFTSSRFNVSQLVCPGYSEGSGVYQAFSKSPFGPFRDPQPIGPDETTCPDSVRNALPYSRLVNTPNCGSAACNNSIRLDGDLFNDPMTGDSWFAYAWYSNSQPLTAWDQVQLGEHVSLVKVDPARPYQVPCDVAAATKVWAWTPHPDNTTLQQLAESCPRCQDMLAFDRGRQNEIVMRDGAVWGVTEGPMLFRRHGYVYLITAHSIWDSAYYAATWVAAPTVEELDISSGVPSPTRLAGRLLVPSLDQSFGHGTAVQGPDGHSWFFVHHHLNHSRCWNPSDVCARDIFLTPLQFEDRNDGRGEVWIKAQFPAEQNNIAVPQARTEKRTALVAVSLGVGLAIVCVVILAALVLRSRAAQRSPNATAAGGQPLMAVASSGGATSDAFEYRAHSSSDADREAALLQQQYNASAGRA